MTPAIVALAYERPAGLQRLLRSLDRASYPDSPVPLVISLDRSVSESAREVAKIAHSFAWRFGPKRIVEQPEHLGVVGHFLASGDLTRNFDAALLLEDDLSVAPGFYDFSCQVLEAYGEDERIAGFCLYALWFNGFTQEPFIPIEDGSDVFFLRVPYTQGLCFSAPQWQRFRDWHKSNSVSGHGRLHPSFLRFQADEWFPGVASYLARTGRFFCFPRVSQTIGWGDSGAHFDNATSWFQTPISLAWPRLRLPLFADARAVYDGFFELLPEKLRAFAPGLREVDFDLDINATKLPENLRSDLVLTTRPVRAAKAKFALAMYPPELNVAFEVPGHEISLARKHDVRWDTWSGVEARRRLHAYYWRRHRSSRGRTLRFALARLLKKFRRS